MRILLKIAFFFYFTLSTIVGNGQILTLRDEQGRKEADEDWAKGAAKYYIFGLRSGQTKDFENGLYLEHFGVCLTYKGCFVLGTEWGYNNRIKEILKEKLQAQYGRDKIISLFTPIAISNQHL